MKVIQLLPRLDLGGVEKGTVELARHLSLKGDRAIIISGGGKLELQLREYGIKHYKLAIYKKSPLVLFYLPELVRIFKKENPDIVHARSRVPAILAYLAFKKYHANLSFYRFQQFVPSFITTAHGHYRRHIFSKVMSKGKFVICPSNSIARHMVEKLNTAIDKIRIIPRGVNLKEYRFILPSSKDWNHPIIAIVARLTPIKGHAEFIRAMKLVLQKKPFARGWIIGAPSPGKEDYLRDLEVMVRRYGLENSIDFLGARYDIPELLEKINILISASHVPEGFGRTIIEAQASGVPVIASRVAGTVELIQDGINGILFPPDDELALANAIIKLIKNPALADKIAQNARKIVEENFKLEDINEKIIANYHEAGNRLNILVIKLGALGDAILTIPSLKALREQFPSAHICLLTTSKVSSLFENCPYVDELVILHSENSILKYLDAFKAISILRKKFWDLSLDFQNNRLSHLVAFLTEASHRFGFAKRKFSFLLNKAVKLPQHPLSPLDQQYLILKQVGVKSFTKELHLWIMPDDLQRMQEFLRTNWLAGEQKLVGINIGSGAKWLSKRLGEDKFVRIIEYLAQYNIRVVLTGATQDIELAQRIALRCEYKPINAVGRTNISELVALISLCNAYLTADSAPLHIASAVKTPVLAIFGPTDPRRHVVAAKNLEIIWRKIKCSPCYNPRCLNNICIKAIPAKEIGEKLLKLSSIKDENSLSNQSS